MEDQVFQIWSQVLPPAHSSQGAGHSRFIANVGVELDHPRSPSALMFSDSLSRFLYQDLQTYLPAELILIKPFKIKLNHTVLLWNHTRSQSSFFLGSCNPIITFVIRIVWIHLISSLWLKAPWKHRPSLISLNLPQCPAHSQSLLNSKDAKWLGNLGTSVHCSVMEIWKQAFVVRCYMHTVYREIVSLVLKSLGSGARSGC